MLTDKDLEPFYKVVEDYLAEVESIYKSKLEDRKATGNLINSISTKYVFNGNEMTCTIELEHYYYWLEHGRKPTSKGKHCPIEPIITWIKAKGIVPEERNGKLPTETQLAYAIRHKMDTAEKDGQVVEKVFEGGHYLQATLDEVNKKYEPLMQDALTQCVVEHIINYYEILP